MQEEGTKARRTAVLVTLDRDVAEIEELAETAGYDILYEMVQKRAGPDPKTYVGRGKLKVLDELLHERPVDTIILNEEAKPSHHYSFENRFKVECVDRIRLILEIFTSRANSKEARLQVEKARLRYEMPLLKEWIHAAKSGEHPGFMGGGEYAVDIYYALIRKRVKAIDDELDELSKSSDQRRIKRDKFGIKTVTLAGYTNAGKSSMMKALTGEDVLIEGRMFSTLSTTTRKIKGLDEDVLLVDTIGFLKDLPHFMIEAFRNTIEEIFTSDLILVMIDSSEDYEEIRKKLIVSRDVLFPRIDSSKLIIILNKIDKRMNKNLNIDLDALIRENFGNVRIVEASALSNIGIEKILDMIKDEFKKEVHAFITIPHQESIQKALSELFDSCSVLKQDYVDEVSLEVRCSSSDVGWIKKMVEDLGGHIKIEEPA